MPDEPITELDVHEEDPRNYPSRFHKKILWSAITAVCLVIIGAIVVGAIAGTSWVLGYLQPLLVPIAVAAIIAYLLEPLIIWLMKRGMTHKKAFWIVFLSFTFGMILLAFLVIKPAVTEATRFGKEYLTAQKIEAPAETTSTAEAGEEGDQETKAPTWFSRTKLGLKAQEALAYLDEKLGDLPLAERFQTTDDTWDLNAFGTWVWSHVSGFADETATFFGRGFSSAASMLGYFLGLFLVPLYLFFFLRESAGIAARWSDYIPLRQSHLKTEIVETLKEINQYLIAYFRGQMLVSIIDGVLIAIALWLMGLPYAFLLGVFLAILGLIPYVGNLLVMIPAVLIAFAHFSNPEARWDWLPQVWAYPLIVLAIFVTLQQINGLVTAPKIVGDSVGLHPLTVIVSMLFWSLLLGGLLGALLAVPLTASVKVLFKRYIWQRRIESQVTEPEPETG